MRCSIDSVPARARVAVAVLALAASACDKSSTAPATPANLIISSGGSQTAVVNTTLPLPIVMHVTDANGAPVAGVVLTFAPTTNQGSVSTAQATTDANGDAQVSWTLGIGAGADTLMVSEGSLSAIVTAAGAPDAPANVTIAAGNNQTAAAGSMLGTALAVRVTDQYGNAVPNATVQWADNGGGAFSTTTASTDANGIASTTYTLGANPGVDDVTAVLSAAPATASVTFVEDAM